MTRISLQETKCLTQKELKGYLEETLDKSTLFRVEDHLLDCDLCSAAVEGLESSENLMTELDQAFDFDFSKRVAEGRKQEAKVVAFSWRRFAAAAAMIGLPIIAGWLYLNADGGQDVFNQHYAYYDNDAVVNVRSYDTSANSKTPLTEAVGFYEAKDFSKSIEAFENILSKNPQNEVAAFFVGLSYLENENLTKSINHLETVRINSGNYYEAATWYLALAYLKAEQIDRTKELLEDLTKVKDDYYVEKAQALLKEL